MPARHRNGLCCLEQCVRATRFVKEQQGNAACVWESPSWANNSVCVQQVVWWRLQPPASGGHVDIDMLRCLQGTCVAWNIATFQCTGKRTAARKYLQEQQGDKWQFAPLHCHYMAPASWDKNAQVAKETGDETKWRGNIWPSVTFSFSVFDAKVLLEFVFLMCVEYEVKSVLYKMSWPCKDTRWQDQMEGSVGLVKRKRKPTWLIIQTIVKSSRCGLSSTCFLYFLILLKKNATV